MYIDIYVCVYIYIYLCVCFYISIDDMDEMAALMYSNPPVVEHNGGQLSLFDQFLSMWSISNVENLKCLEFLAILGMKPNRNA